MNALDELWAVTEERLLGEASSLGGLLAGLRPRISPALIGGIGWDSLVARACDLPATFAAFPFGFEVRLTDPRPCVDLGVSLVCGSRTAQWFLTMGRAPDADPVTAGIARLVCDKVRQGSGIRRITGPKMLLEYDVRPAAGGSPAQPGTFLYPTEQPIFGSPCGGGERAGDVGIVLDGVVTATARHPDAAERREVERVYRTLDSGTRIMSVGAFPSRERMVRLALAGPRRTSDVLKLLEHVGWPGERSTVSAVLSRLQEANAFASLAVHVDVRAGGLGPALGIGLYARDTDWLRSGKYWLADGTDWAAFVETVEDMSGVVPAKLSALAGWSSGAETLFGKSSRFVLIRGIHHVKLVVNDQGLDEIKAYVFLMLCALPSRER